MISRLDKKRRELLIGMFDDPKFNLGEATDALERWELCNEIGEMELPKDVREEIGITQWENM